MIEHSRIQCGEIELYVATAGPVTGPLVILLHGFPEYSGGWGRQMRDLAALGFRVLAPDQRGYGQSEKPNGIRAYSLDILAGDIAKLIESTGRSSAVIIGHDWGALVAWYLALKYPEKVAKLMVLNCPHPLLLRKAAFLNPIQFLKSWYVFFIQLPFLPEFFLSISHFSQLKKTMVNTARANTFSSEELEGYRRAWAQPQALTGMLNWYRAFVRYPPKEKLPPKVICPTLILWGKHDAFIALSLAHKSLHYCERAKIITFPKATHWIHHEFPNEVSHILKEFCQDRSTSVNACPASS
jgi:pimeloyl-ACP methyl ester carboxylesterase